VNAPQINLAAKPADELALHASKRHAVIDNEVVRR
jgi:hypothetical protein